MKTYAVAVPGFIKIGRARDVAKRVRTIQTHSPHQLELIGVADRDIEHEVHARLYDHRERGEWFRDTSQVRETLALYGFVYDPYVQFRSRTVAEAERWLRYWLPFYRDQLVEMAMGDGFTRPTLAGAVKSLQVKQTDRHGYVYWYLGGQKLS